MMEIKQVFCFGFGYSAQYFANLLKGRNVKVIGTYRNSHEHKIYIKDEVNVTLHRYDDNHHPLSEDALDGLATSSHILITIPPNIEGDRVFKDYHRFITSDITYNKRVIYLSTIGVYGDHKGAYINENTELIPRTGRAKKRLLAENEWISLEEDEGLPNTSTIILRLPGIYGYKRSVFDKISQGKDRIIIKKGQYFNRIHVEDIAQAIYKAMIYNGNKRIFNVVDGNPCPPEEVVYFANELLGVDPPMALSFEEAEMSKLGRSFFMENKRVGNDLLKDELRVELKYPDYKLGLMDIYKIIHAKTC